MYVLTVSAMEQIAIPGMRQFITTIRVKLLLIIEKRLLVSNTHSNH